MQGTADFHHDITNTLLPQADPVFDDATALDTTVDMLDPQSAIVEHLVGSLLRQSACCTDAKDCHRQNPTNSMS
jgi:hypothetical protein